MAAPGDITADLDRNAVPVSDAATLPHGVALLCVAAREPAWANLTLQLDAVGCHEPRFRWVSTAVDMLAALRDESFDCLVIADDSTATFAETKNRIVFNGFEMLRAIRIGGHDDPAVLVTRTMTEAHWTLAVDLDCAILTSDHGWESRALVPILRKELQQTEMKRDNYRLSLDRHRRLLREQDETEHLLNQQRQILQELHDLVDTPTAAVDAPSVETVPQESADTTSQFLAAHDVCRFYDELLRTYVMMGSGRLGEEIPRFAELLATANVSPREALSMHLKRVEALVRGLGSRSSRHVMSRADLLALELVMHLGECYCNSSSDGGPAELRDAQTAIEYGNAAA